MKSPQILATSLLSLALAVTGCKTIGPGTISHDRFNYSTALANSWKEQMLLNLVKTRYLDLPIYLDVGQIVSGYTFETGVSISGQVSPQSMRGDTFGALGAHGTFTDRPTITYTPLTGDRFLQGFLMPMNPARVFSLVQSGYAADFILEVSLDSLNGLRNRPVAPGSKRLADPDFFRTVSLMRHIQEAGAVGLHVEQGTNGQPTTVIILRAEKTDPETQAKMKELQDLLGLEPNQSAFRLVQSPVRGGPGDLSVATRSLAQIMAALSGGVEVPPSHQKRNLIPPIPGLTAGEEYLVRVHSGPKPPEDSFVSVKYEGEWFWIANDDWKSKRTFSSILFLFTLADSGGEQKLPTITIPAQ